MVTEVSVSCDKHSNLYYSTKLPEACSICYVAVAGSNRQSKGLSCIVATVMVSSVVEVFL